VPLQIPDPPESQDWTLKALHAIRLGGQRLPDLLDSATMRQREQRFEAMKRQFEDKAAAVAYRPAKGPSGAKLLKSASRQRRVGTKS